MATSLTLTPEEIEALLNGPALAPPLGVVPNFDTTDNLAVYAVPTVLLALCITFVVLVARVFTRRWVVRSMSWEDYLAILGWFMLVGYCVPTLLTAKYAGKHQWDTRLKDLFSILFYSNIVQVMYGPSIFTIKLSILLQYFRVFVPTRQGNRTLYYAIHLLLWSDLSFYIIDTMLEIFSCTPREYIWNKLSPPGRCFDVTKLIVISGSINVVSDLAILCLPIVTIMRLQMPFQRRLTVAAVFATGLLACITSVVRLYYSVLLTRTEDISRLIVPPGLWGIAEIAIGFICCCLPTLPKFFQFVGGKLSRRGTTRTRTTARNSPFNTMASENQQGLSASQTALNNPYSPLKKSTEEVNGWELSPGRVRTEVKINRGDESFVPDQFFKPTDIVQTTVVKVHDRAKLPHE